MFGGERSRTEKKWLEERLGHDARELGTAPVPRVHRAHDPRRSAGVPVPFLPGTLPERRRIPEEEESQERQKEEQEAQEEQEGQEGQGRTKEAGATPSKKNNSRFSCVPGPERAHLRRGAETLPTKASGSKN